MNREAQDEPSLLVLYGRFYPEARPRVEKGRLEPVLRPVQKAGVPFGGPELAVPRHDRFGVGH